MKLPALDSLSPRRRKQVIWLLRVLFVYAVVGFLILPPIVRAVMARQLAAQLHREVSIRSVRINPFALSATVRGLLIKDKDGEPFVSWDEVYVNFQLSSFLGHPWVFREISTTRPYVRVQVNPDHTLNFSDLLEQAATNAPSGGPSRPLALRVNRLQIKGASASLADLTMRTPFRRIVGPLDVTLEKFHTDPSNKNPYSFTGTTDAGETFSWSGHFFLSPLRSQGELALENISLNKYAPLYQDLVRFEIKDGVASVRSTYNLELSPSNRVASVTNTSFTLTSLKVTNPDTGVDVVEQQTSSVSGVSVDLVSHKAEVDSVSASGGRLVLRRDKDKAINVVELAKPAEDLTNAPGSIVLLLHSISNAVVMLLDSTNTWSATIHDVNVSNFALSLEDLANSRPARLELDNITLTARNISNLPHTNLNAALSLRWNTNGSIKTEITAHLAPPTADIHIALDQLDLHPIDPFLESKVNVLILGSKLGMDGHVHASIPKGRLPEITFQGDTWLDDFASADGVLGEDLLKWQSVKIKGIDANLNPPSVVIQEIAVNDAYARVVIETNRTINLLAALNMTTSTNTAEPEADEQQQVPPARAETATNATSPAGLPKITIGAVVVTNAQMRFTDRSLTPNVNLSIQQVNGSIAGLSSEELQHADLDLHARVDNVGPVAVTGTINPFSEHSTNNIKIAVSDVDLTPTSPYGGKFAGYRIARGKLNLDLDYHLIGRSLKSENVITLDQFTFGEKVNSPDATKLPVRLAIAVMKDRDGKIVLDVPIEGSLDDPQFKLGRVITRALVNILTKIVTSPFAVLGAVFGGHGEELSYQNFTPGSAGLLPPAKEKLDSLVKGLYERPGLQLEIAGSIDPVADLDGLKQAALEKQLRTRKWNSLRKSERATNTVDQVTLMTEERTDLIRKLYGEALGRGEIDLAKLSANTNTAAMAALLSPKPTGPRKGATLQLEGVKAPEQTSTGAPAPAAQVRTVTDPMELALLTTFNVTDSDFQALAAGRAQAVRDYILASGKVEAERLFLTESESGAVKSEGSRVYLQFR